VSADRAPGGAGALPTVSVVIPTCDRPVLLARAIASARAQTAPAGEIIVVDDGTDDGARAQPAAGVRVVRNDRARGPSGARNCGAASARGALLAFLDDDDEWLPSYLAAAAAHVAANDLDVVCTDLLYRYADGLERKGKVAPGRPRRAGVSHAQPRSHRLEPRHPRRRLRGGGRLRRVAADGGGHGLRPPPLLQPGLRYAPLRERLVRHHHHDLPRLCTRRGDAMRAGIRRFFALHGARMDAAQREEFGRAVRTLWSIDEFGHDQEPPP
jgi:glycosyltransferase involved in cell wall biosynthesis